MHHILTWCRHSPRSGNVETHERAQATRDVRRVTFSVLFLCFVCFSLPPKSRFFIFGYDFLSRHADEGKVVVSRIFATVKLRTGFMGGVVVSVCLCVSGSFLPCCLCICRVGGRGSFCGFPLWKSGVFFARRLRRFATIGFADFLR